MDANFELRKIVDENGKISNGSRDYVNAASHKVKVRMRNAWNDAENSEEDA